MPGAISIGGLPDHAVYGGSVDGRLLVDTFVGTEGTTPPNHLPDLNKSGNPWVDQTAGATIESNKLSDNQADRISYLNVGTADVRITCTLTINGNDFFGLLFRRAASDQFYIAGADIDNDATVVWINNAGWTQIASVAHTYVQGQVVNIEVILKGSSIKVIMDGVADVDITNSAVNGTAHGIYVDGGTWSADGLWDNFIVHPN